MRSVDLKNPRVLVPARVTKDVNQLRQICLYVPPFDLPLPHLVLNVFQLRLGTTRGYNRGKHKEILNMLPLPLVWVTHRTTATRKTSYHLQEVVKEAPARAHGPGPIPLAPPTGAKQAWAMPNHMAMGSRSLVPCPCCCLCSPVCHCPARAVRRTYPLPGGTRGRGGRGRAWAWKRLLGLDWATSPSPPPATGHESSYLIPGYWGSPAARLPPAKPAPESAQAKQTHCGPKLCLV
jgi:hypothetical protein